MEVGINTWKLMRLSVNAPIKIQNSLEYTDASFSVDGISFHREIDSTTATAVKKNK